MRKLLQHGCRQQLRFAVVVDIDIEHVHGAIVIVHEQFLHGGAARVGIDLRLHERAEIRIQRQVVDRGQLQPFVRALRRR